MKNRELIALLQQRHPDAQVDVHMHPSFTPHKRVIVGEYVLMDIVDVGDWGNPGSANDLVTINVGRITGY